MDVATIFIVMIVIIVIVIKVMKETSNNKTSNEKEELLKIFNEYVKNVANKLVYYNIYSKNYEGIVVDDDNKEFYLIKVIDRTIQKHKIKYEELLSVEFITDGQVDRVAKENVLGRAALGGLAFGGIGALIGANTAKSVNEGRRIIRISLLINNPTHPEYSITFMDTDYTKSTYGLVDIVYQKIIVEAREWNALFSYIVKQPKEPDQEKIVSHTTTHINTSVVDELSKLADLRNKGIIDENEFILLKKKLLSN